MNQRFSKCVWDSGSITFRNSQINFSGKHKIFVYLTIFLRMSLLIKQSLMYKISVRNSLAIKKPGSFRKRTSNKALFWSLTLEKNEWWRVSFWRCHATLYKITCGLTPKKKYTFKRIKLFLAHPLASEESLNCWQDGWQVSSSLQTNSTWDYVRDKIIPLIWDWGLSRGFRNLPECSWSRRKLFSFWGGRMDECYSDTNVREAIISRVQPIYCRDEKVRLWVTVGPSGILLWPGWDECRHWRFQHSGSGIRGFAGLTLSCYGY